MMWRDRYDELEEPTSETANHCELDGLGVLPNVKEGDILTCPLCLQDAEVVEIGWREHVFQIGDRKKTAFVEHRGEK